MFTSSLLAYFIGTSYLYYSSKNTEVEPEMALFIPKNRKTTIGIACFFLLVGLCLLITHIGEGSGLFAGILLLVLFLSLRVVLTPLKLVSNKALLLIFPFLITLEFII